MLIDPKGLSDAAFSLECKPGKEGHFLMFPYRLQNLGRVDVFVMDALPGFVDEANLPTVDRDFGVVVHGPGDDVTLGKFIAPLPTDRRIAMPVIPLARHLPAGGVLEGLVRTPVPFAETSPYFADLTLRQYEAVDIKGVAFTIGYWMSARDGIATSPVDYAPDLSVIVTRNTTRSALAISQYLPVRALQLFRRNDAFPRLS
jgi:hypothetical protein